MENTKFIEGGDIIPLPENTYLTGIIVLQNCTIEGCEFFRTTMMIGENDAKNIADAVPGIKVAGL